MLDEEGSRIRENLVEQIVRLEWFKILRYRNKRRNRRCTYCAHLRSRLVGIEGVQLTECVAKGRDVRPSARRPFCGCFKIADPIEEQRASEHCYDVVNRLAAAVVDYRVDRNLTQVDLAKELGVTERMVIRYESGDANIDLKELLMLCDRLHLDLGYVLSGREG